MVGFWRPPLRDGLTAIVGKRWAVRRPHHTFSGKAGMMFKAVVEMLGAFFAGAPVSETARGRRARLMAFAMLTLAALVGARLVLRG